MYHSLETKIWFLIIFLSLKKSLNLFQIWTFCLTFTYYVPFEDIKNRFKKSTSSILMETVTIPVELVVEWYFYLHHPHKSLTF